MVAARIVGVVLAITVGGCNVLWGVNDIPPLDDASIDATIPHFWSSISLGYTHACALKTDDTLWCWGRNDAGQVGRPGTLETTTPGSVDGNATWLEVSTGMAHTCGIQTDKTLWCWGHNFHGAIGTNDPDGVVIDRPKPIGGEWRHVAAGLRHTCAIKTDGTLWCWGANNRQALGVGAADDLPHPEPLQVADAGPWDSVSAGSEATCAIKTSDRSLWCWGANDLGQSGAPGGGTIAQPAQVDTQRWTEVVSSANFSCGILEDGRLRCWGVNDLGQLGDDTTTMRATPAPVDHDQISGWIDIVAGVSHACGRTADRMYCWGSAHYGQLAVDISPFDFRSIPIEIDTPTPHVIATGANTTCATIAGTNELWCAGLGAYGQRGDGVGSHTSPTKSLDAAPTRMMALGGAATCSLENGVLRCWGDNLFGGVGDNTRIDRQLPVTIPPTTGGSYAQVAVGDHTCAIAANAKMFCWGYNANGGVGDNTLIDKLVPTPVSNTTDLWLSVSSAAVTCARSTTSKLFCWGLNDSGQGGHVTTFPRLLVPSSINGLWAGVDVGDFSTCAVDLNNRVQCFGNNMFGSLGDGTITSRYTPALAMLPAGAFPKVATGVSYACAPGNPMYCWGLNQSGNLGNQTVANALVPVVVLGNWISVDAGGRHTCAIKSDRTLWCFGANGFGQLGDGTFVEHHSPTQVGTDTNWDIVNVGLRHSCASKLDGTVWCWGANDRGQLGDGTAWTTIHTEVP